MSDEAVEESCLCGAVKYRVAPFLRAAHCHRSRCRRATGSSRASSLSQAADLAKGYPGAQLKGSRVRQERRRDLSARVTLTGALHCH